MNREIEFRVWNNIKYRNTTFLEKILFLLLGDGLIFKIGDEKSGTIKVI